MVHTWKEFYNLKLAAATSSVIYLPNHKDLGMVREKESKNCSFLYKREQDFIASAKGRNAVMAGDAEIN